MIPPVFTILNANSAVKAVFGSNPLRVFPWGMAPQNITKPYATYLLFNGNPENTMGELPEIDIANIQVDVWAETSSAASDGADAIRDALEQYAHMTAFSTEPPDETTDLHRFRMDFDFFEER